MTAPTCYHRAFGLRLALPLPCPVLPVDQGGASADISATWGTLPATLPDAALTDGPYQFTPTRFLYNASADGCRFLVENGTTITIERTPAASDEAICFHLLDLPLVMALLQRGLIVLHANAVATPWGAVAVGGDSGAGKSTLLATLLAQGHPMLSDDAAAICLDGQGHPLVLPGIPHYHLLDDAADRLGQSVSGLPRRKWGVPKTTVTAQERLADQPAPLRLLITLHVGDRPDLTCTPLHGADRLEAIRAHLYGVESLLDQRPYFRQLTAIAATVPVWRIERPRDRWTIPQISAWIADTLRHAA
jgi:hypothetical protein